MGSHRAPNGREGWLRGVKWQPPGKLGEPGWEFDSDRWGDAILLAVVLLFAIIGIGGLVYRFLTI